MFNMCRQCGRNPSYGDTCSSCDRARNPQNYVRAHRPQLQGYVPEANTGYWVHRDNYVPNNYALEEDRRRAREEAERRVREEAERRVREEAERRVREEAERRVREEAERRVREEAERRAREYNYQHQQYEAQRQREIAQARQEAERQARLREEAERKLKETERKLKEAERKRKEAKEKNEFKDSLTNNLNSGQYNMSPSSEANTVLIGYSPQLPNAPARVAVGALRDLRRSLKGKGIDDKIDDIRLENGNLVVIAKNPAAQKRLEEFLQGIMFSAPSPSMAAMI